MPLNKDTTWWQAVTVCLYLWKHLHRSFPFFGLGLHHLIPRLQEFSMSLSDGHSWIHLILQAVIYSSFLNTTCTTSLTISCCLRIYNVSLPTTEQLPYNSTWYATGPTLWVLYERKSSPSCLAQIPPHHTDIQTWLFFLPILSQSTFLFFNV